MACASRPLRIPSEVVALPSPPPCAAPCAALTKDLAARIEWAIGESRIEPGTSPAAAAQAAVVILSGDGVQVRFCQALRVAGGVT